MRKGGRVAAAFLLAVALCTATHGARAETDEANQDQDSYILAALAKPASGQPGQSSASQISANQEQARLLLFSNSDFWRQGGFTYGGLLWAPSGLDREGPVLKLIFGGGVYYYLSGALGNADVRGEELAGSVLPGWRFVRNGFTITTFLGYDFQQHRLTPDDPSAGLHGRYSGARAGFELWYEPTATTMVAADASVSTIGPSYNVRLATGWRAFDAFYVGPEVQAFGADDNYRQFRAGLHVTGFRTGQFEWSTGVGWADDTDHHSGAYGKLGVFTRR